jgi:pimeloyl-ACP methyl ester carboxylesterase
MREGTVQLPDGRALGYAEYGDPGGRPIVMFHGGPGSRSYDLEPDALHAAGARLLSVERPGIGLSTPKRAHALADWPADVAAFADAVGVDRFAVIGTSAGGSYGFATAAALPDRVTCLGLQCAMGPAFEHPEFDEEIYGPAQVLLPFARQDQEGVKPLVYQFLGGERASWLADREAYWQQFLLTWPEVDRPVFEQFKDRWFDNLDAAHTNEDAFADDIINVYGPWDIDFAAIRVPVRAWHGDADTAAPLGLITLAVTEAGGDVVVYPGEGHYLDRAHHADWIAWLLSHD